MQWYIYTQVSNVFIKCILYELPGRILRIHKDDVAYRLEQAVNSFIRCEMSPSFNSL